MNKKTLKKLGLASLIGLASVGAFAASTFAWFTQEGTDTSATFTAGEVKYTLNVSDLSTEKVVPGQNIFDGGSFAFTNQSTVTTNLRMQISYTITPVKTGVATLEGSVSTTDNYLKLASAGSWVENGGWLYYGSATGGTDDTTAKVAVGANPVVGAAGALNVTLNGSTIGNDYQGAAIALEIKFQAKQSDYITWAEAASINFETGLAS